MTDPVDLTVKQKSELGNIYDIAIDPATGDFELNRGFDTTLVVSLFEERRADPSEVPTAHLRRGWWGNAINERPDFQIGSKLWLLYQERRTQTTLNKAINYAREALQWMIEDGLVEDVFVDGEFTTEGIRLTIDLIRANSVVESRYFNLWEQTGRGDIGTP